MSGTKNVTITNGLGTSETMPNIYREGITSTDQWGGV
jgi:hypothetical protein